MRLFSMSVQERDYLQDRPLHDVPAIQLDHADIAAKSVADEKRSIEMDAAKKQLAAEKKRVKQLLAKIEDMHTATATALATNWVIPWLLFSFQIGGWKCPNCGRGV